MGFLIDGTPLLRVYARRRLARLAALDPARAQERELLALVRAAADTRFGRDHGFARLRSVADFQAAVPLRRYEAFWHDYWQAGYPLHDDVTWPGRMPYFAVTSGTSSGTTKRIPVSHQMNRANSRAAADLLVHHIGNRPHSRILAGKSFLLGGSTALVEEAPGVFSGDLSGIAVGAMPWWARAHHFPPQPLALLEDWEEKIDRLGRRALAEDIRSLSGVPSWLLILFDRLAEIAPERGHRCVDYFPDLEMLVHGGVNFIPYRKRFDALLEGSHAELREVYPASEGFVALADARPEDGLRPLLDNGLFLEFVPLEEIDSPAPTRHWIATVQPGINYAVVLSSNAGLWAYVLGDTVSFVSTAPHRLVVTGRISYMLSAFGEHLIEQEIEESIAEAAEAIGAALADFSVGPLYPSAKGELGGHLWIVEFAGAVPDAARLARFAEVLDRALGDTNDDYKAHRAGGFGLRPPTLRAVPPGTFAAWMRARGKLGGQHKVPRILTDPTLLDHLRAFADGQG